MSKVERGVCWRAGPRWLLTALVQYHFRPEGPDMLRLQ